MVGWHVAAARPGVRSGALTALGVALLTAGFPAFSQARAPDKLKTLFQFTPQSGTAPQAGITLSEGALYGTTSTGGTGHCFNKAGCGTVYRLTRSGTSWAEQNLYNFRSKDDGAYPIAPVTVADGGRVYGYTGQFTLGSIFRLDPPAKQGGAWTYHLLYQFQGGPDGNLTTASTPLIAQGGSLYGIASGGTSQNCGNNGCGSVFRLDPGPNGTLPWIKTTLFTFTGDELGGLPDSLVGPTQGALYVATGYGSSVVMLTPPPGGGAPWSAEIVASISPQESLANLVLAADGTLFGTASQNGQDGQIYAFVPGQAGQPWSTTQIADLSHEIYAPTSLGIGPGGSLLGVIYGIENASPGLAFALQPPKHDGGRWSFRKLWDFSRDPDQGPLNIVAGRGSTLYGATSPGYRRGGGADGGAVFELRPR